MRAFRAEWTKLSRRNTLVGFGVTIVGFAALATVLIFLNAGGAEIGRPGGPPGSGGEGPIDAARLSLADGAALPIAQAATFLTIIGLALFATNLAGEYHTGTIRVLFVTEPNRLRVLAGKLAALGSFVAIWVAVGAVVSVAIGAFLASGAGVATDAWWTAEGLAAIAATYVNVTATVILAGIIGATLAILTRSAAIAISAGVAYFLVVETLISGFWDALGEWGLSAAANSLARGGTAAITYGTAVILSIGYGLLSVAIASAVFARRDVTS